MSMIEKDDGGAAFPVVWPDDKGVQFYGMTLRDYFAAKFITGVTSTTEYFNGEWSLESLAKQAYELADAMLEARK